MNKLGKWPVGGYAPGGYACCRCTTCDEYFMAAKRAYTCAECTIQNLLAERDDLEAEMELLKKKEVEEVMWRECHIEELEAENKRLREALHSVAFRSVDDDIHWCQRIAQEALAQTFTKEGEE